MRNKIRFPEEFTPNVTPRVLLAYLDIEFERLDADTDDLFDATSTDGDLVRQVHLRPLLGLQYIAGATRSVGVESVILDNRLVAFDPRRLGEYANINGIMMVGFYSSLAQTRITSAFIRQLKGFTDLPIVVGGPGYIDFSTLLAAGADAVVRGEGEATVADIVTRLGQGNIDWAAVSGIAHSRDDRHLETPERSLLDPNLIAHPVRDNFIQPTEYRDYFLPGFRPNFVSMFATRGCPHSCTYCDSPNIWGNTVRQRTPDNVLAEIDEVVEKWGVRYIDMVDDVFGVGFPWLEEFCTKLAERRYNLRYKALINPNTYGRHQEQAMALLAASGCNTLGIGMQTADPGTLHFIDRKSQTPDWLVSVVAAAKKHGILTFVNFILGFPGEPQNTPELIMELVDRTRPHLIDCYGLLYIKGTALYERRLRGEVENGEEFAKRFDNADRVRHHFYANPINLLRFFFWLVCHNPYWLLFMLGKAKLFLSFMVSKSSKSGRHRVNA